VGGSPANKRNNGQKSNGQQAKTNEKGCAEPPEKPVAKPEQVAYQADAEHKADSGQPTHAPPAVGSQAGAQALRKRSRSGTGHRGKFTAGIATAPAAGAAATRAGFLRY